MEKVYYLLVKSNKRTIKQVPKEHQEAVRALLVADGITV
ncbi:MAG: CD1375 family protein [Anaerocolumna sp.]